MKSEIANEGLKAAPPVAVSGVAWMQGLNLTDLVALATLAYIGLQTVYLLWRWWKQIQRGRK